jgi:hypothetical protein
MTATPQHALIVSADIGEGHNAAGRALEEAVPRIWPRCQVSWLDTLAVMGPRFARLARSFYVAQVQHLPWMHEFFFAAMWRHHWYLESARRGIVSACPRSSSSARWGPRRYRSLWLATACGADFGVTAFLLKVVPDTLPQGFGDPLRQWPLYLLVIAGALGFILNQNAFQAGALIAPVLAIITALDPLVSIGIARVWLHESFGSSPSELAAEALSLTVMTGGIAALAHRAPQAARTESGPAGGVSIRRP